MGEESNQSMVIKEGLPDSSLTFAGFQTALRRLDVVDIQEFTDSWTSRKVTPEDHLFETLSNVTHSYQLTTSC